MVIQLSIFDLFLAVGAVIYKFTKSCADDSAWGLRMCLSLESFGNSGSMMLSCCFAHCLYCVGKEGAEDFLHQAYKSYAKICYAAAIITAITAFAVYSGSPKDFRDTVLSVLWIVQFAISLIVSLAYYIKGFELVYQRGNSIP
jgi:hypothetical protein